MTHVNPDAIVTGNIYDKFNTTNPIAKRLMDGFKASFREFYTRADARQILEVGCGEGYMLEIMRDIKAVPFTGMDIGMDVLQQAVNRMPEADLSLADGHHLPYANQRFDTVVCCEVLEHVDDPEAAVRELHRVTGRYLIASVPREPIWRALNMARGSFWADWGNTPGHVNHWSSRGFVKLLSGHFKVLAVKQPLPWTMVLCERV